MKKRSGRGRGLGVGGWEGEKGKADKEQYKHQRHVTKVG